MLCLDVRGSILAGVVPRKKYYAACFLCVAFKHGSLVSPSVKKLRALVYPQPAEAIRAPIAARDLRAPPELCCALPGWRSACAHDVIAASTQIPRLHFARRDLRWVRRPAIMPALARARALLPRAVAPLRITPPHADSLAIPNQLPQASVSKLQAPHHTLHRASATASPHFRPP